MEIAIRKKEEKKHNPTFLKSKFYRFILFLCKNFIKKAQFMKKTFNKMDNNQSSTTFLLRNDVNYSLFKFAINSAKKGLKVWFISVKPFEKVPKDIEPPCKDTLQLITFIYLNDFAALIKHLNSVHKWNNIPNYLILKNFDLYSNLYDSEYDPTTTGFLVASLLDCVEFLSKKNNSKVHLLVTCLKKDNNLNFKRLKILQDLYFDNFLFDDNLDDDEIVQKIEAF